jgi:hypothetical protein
LVNLILIAFYLQYVALKTALRTDEVEICLVNEPQANVIRAERTIDPKKDNLRVLGDQETLAELIKDYHNISLGYLVNLKVDCVWCIHKYLLTFPSHNLCS